MRGLLVLVAALVGSLSAVPVAHGVTATLNSPTSGTLYTGSSGTVQVAWSGSFDYSPCSGPSDLRLAQVQRYTGPSPPGGNWPNQGSPNPPGSGGVSGTLNLGPGVYHFKAWALCDPEGPPPHQEHTSSSATVTVVAGSAPPTISDRDLDGVTDSSDQCPDVPGVPANNGCPVLDPPAPVPPAAKPDGDPVPDAKDKCPDASGPVWKEGCPATVPAAPRRKTELKARSARSSVCSLSKLRAERRAKAPKMEGGPQVAKLKRCYARDVPGVPDGWPLITFWANAKHKPAFEVFPPDLRPASAPPITRATLPARAGFNVYTVKKEKTPGVLGLPVFSILTAETTRTNTGGRLQCGVIFPTKGSVGSYRRVPL